LRHFWLHRAEIELLARLFLGDDLVDGVLPNRSDGIPKSRNCSYHRFAPYN